MSKILIDLTVAIPTYNGAKRLPLVLEKLHEQVDTENIAWEIIIVDNNSTDETARIVRDYQANWQKPFPLKYCLETEQGAAFARKKAVKEAQGNLIGFLDDDTLPAPNWVAAAYKFAREHPQAGAYGSQVHGDYEVEPPANFDRIASFFAITERGDKPHLYEPSLKMLPPSAGLVVRKQAWCENVPEQPFLSGRSGKSILNSEDLEVVMYIQNAGWEVWYNSEMEIYHQIKRDRLTREYLLYLMRSTGLARHHIRMLRLKPWQRPLFFPLGLAKDLQKAIAYFLKNRNLLEKDVVAACEMEFLRSSVISPFYLWRISLKI
ncbi:hormogonium polysaccharide biosynthesis glycosyltransferase HpsE [Oscillatoria salina]|uniref:hormogonium polysaccharide biosynthesis glycosyltransferase HpsE n=1 Tax=Oscillatoria salina TaxID=331517 RepID=UPI0013B915A9|nr:hormogonium polysaccharide biosynthesis glycosyltransferase HpsE [Oscillatoria salina]MBZ8182197.1 glycosyltransferase family 2 protein [Oscillatoria salina IIICB1]NET89062.1 glycosyltransferase family 2 protein [Kamptonema sp. SIO1D9]